jgi:hypothetical protein
MDSQDAFIVVTAIAAGLTAVATLGALAHRLWLRKRRITVSCQRMWQQRGATGEVFLVAVPNGQEAAPYTGVAVLNRGSRTVRLEHLSVRLPSKSGLVVTSAIRGLVEVPPDDRFITGIHGDVLAELLAGKGITGDVDLRVVVTDRAGHAYHSYRGSYASETGELHKIHVPLAARILGRLKALAS